MEELERKLAVYSGKVIRELRKQRGYTQQELGNLIGVSNSAVANYEKGYRAPLQDTLCKLSEVFEVSINTFFPKEAKESKLITTYRKLKDNRKDKVYSFAEYQLEEQNNLIKEEDYIDIGLYGALSAGTGQTIYDNPVEEVPVPVHVIPDKPYDIMLKIVGDSMSPAFKDGEYVFVKLTKDIRSGQFAAIIVDGEAYLKKVYIEDDYLRLVSLNKDYEDIIVDEKSDIEIVGTIVL